jgi:hypothetical protein
MRAPTKAEVFEARKTFFRVVGVCAAVLVVLHLAPKNNAPRDGFRLLCTLAYFAAALTLCWQMLGPRARYAELLFAWCYEDCPEAIERAWRRYLYSFNQAVNIFIYLLMVFLGSTALATFNLWFYGLSPLSFLYNVVWWLSLIGLVLFPFAGGYLLSELAQRRRNLMEQVALTGDYQPRRRHELYTADDPAEQEPVRATGDHAFQAGGMPWNWEDFTKNCIVFGQPGSGKTVCVLNALIDGLLSSCAKSPYPPSGLLLDPKGDFCGKIRTLCRRYGREDDLLIIDPARPDESIRWNPLDTDDDELEVASRFAAVMECLGQKQGDTSFWVDSAKKFIRHAISLIRLTNPPGEPPSFAQIGELAASLEAIVERTDRLDVTNPACDSCLAFFANEWADLADATRTSIQAHITNMVDPFLMPPYATLFAGRSTIRVADILDTGKILYVNMPIADKEAMARTIGTFVKLEYFREVLKRPGKERSSFFFCDEFQVFFTTTQGKGDPDFFERSRQSNHANIIATQNLPAILKQTERKEIAHNLLGNCAVKIFLRNTDRETNQYASELFGQELVAHGNASAGAGVGLGRFQFQGMGQSVGGSDQYDHVVRPERFAELAIPSQAQQVDYCESIIHLAARAKVVRRQRKQKWKIHPIRG